MAYGQGRVLAPPPKVKQRRPRLSLSRSRKPTANRSKSPRPAPETQKSMGVGHVSARARGSQANEDLRRLGRRPSRGMRGERLTSDVPLTLPGYRSYSHDVGG